MSEEKINEIKIKMTQLSSDLKYIKEALEKHIDKEESSIDKIVDTIEKFMQNADSRYAKISFEKDLLTLKTNIEQRNYEWLKYLITAIISGAISYLLLHHKQ